MLPTQDCPLDREAEAGGRACSAAAGAVTARGCFESGTSKRSRLA